MSTQDQFSPTNNGKPARAGTAHPPCPQCQRLMILKTVTPVLFALDFDDMIYRCDRCGTEAKRTVKRA